MSASEEVANTLVGIKEILGGYLEHEVSRDERVVRVPMEGELKKQCKAALSEALSPSVIEECRSNENELEKYGIGPKALKFELEISRAIWNPLQPIWDKIKDLIDDIKGLIGDIKDFLKKLFKAINILIDSLIKAFPKLHVVKEIKEQLENLII